MRIGEVLMKIEVLANVDSVARKAAAIIAAEARSAVAVRGRFLIGVPIATEQKTTIFRVCHSRKRS